MKKIIIAVLITLLLLAGCNAEIKRVETPTFSLAAGSYDSVQTVEIKSATVGATIYYTNDGTDPSSESTLYSEAISVAYSHTIKAIAIKTDIADSEISSAKYTINLPEKLYTATAYSNDGSPAILTIDNSYTGIDAKAFYNCTGLTSITIPSSVTSIGEGAFRECTGLTSITIPSSVTSIGFQAFYGCTGLTSIIVDSANSYYTSEDGVLFNKDKTSLVAYPCGKEGSSYAIPSSVTSIGFQAFYGCTGLTSITIPESVTSIGNWAFVNCTGLTSITIPSSVTSIGEGAFQECTGLTSITIPSSVTSIGEGAFQECTGLTSITFSGTATQWNAVSKGDDWNYNVPATSVICTDSEISYAKYTNDDYVNAGKPSVLVIDNSYTGIDAKAFYNCTGLTSITIPSSVTSIGFQAFYGCTGLTSIIVDSANSYYTSEDGVLFNKDKTSLVAYPCGKEGSSYAIPSSVTSIGFQAFYGCTGLTSITIPSSVTSIGFQAFYGCTGLTSITIPESVTSIGEGAFRECTSLASITFSGTATQWNAVSKGDDWNYNVPATSVICTDSEISYAKYTNDDYVNAGKPSVLVIDNSYTGIDAKAFYNCTGLTSITIPSSVTSIGFQAFYGCTGLTSIIVDSANSYYSSEDGVLFNRDKTSLAAYPCGKEGSSYAIPSSVTSIGSEAFLNCTGLTGITIPSSVTFIGFQAFIDCTGLTSIIVDSANSYYSSENGVLFNKDKTSLIAYPCGKEGSSYAIPSSVTSIGEQAFFGCTGLTSITIPESVTSIGNWAFSDCTGLTSITIPSSVTSIGKQAFYGCTGLTSITIPGSVTSIGDWAFFNCRGLTSITIPGSVTSIGDWAFIYCRGLTSITIPGSVTSIGEGAFRECTSLASITFSGTITQWNAVSKEDDWNYNVPATSVICTDSEISYAKYTNDDYVNAGKPSVLVIDNSYTGIDAKAFYNCTGLTSITIPSSVTSIGNRAFFGCTGLTRITIPSSVTSIGFQAFYGCTGLTSIIVDSANSYYTSEDGVLFNKDKTSLVAYPCGKEGSSYAIPSSVTSIGKQAFFSCTGLTSITIPESVTSIGNWAFSDCTGLTSITIPGSVTSIGDWAFVNCRGLTSIIVDSANSYYSSEDGVLFNKDKTSLIAYPCGKEVSSYAIPSSVSSIGDWTFEVCSGLTSITIPSSVTSIGEGAFRECTSLASITFSGTATQWNAVSKGDDWNYNVPATSVICTDSEISYAKYTNDDYVNAGKPSVLVIDNSYTGIDAKAFYNCTGLTSITIPSSVTSIGFQAFVNCTSLASITFSGTITQWNAVSKEDDWNYNVPATSVTCSDGDVTL